MFLEHFICKVRGSTLVPAGAPLHNTITTTGTAFPTGSYENWPQCQELSQSSLTHPTRLSGLGLSQRPPLTKLPAKTQSRCYTRSLNIKQPVPSKAQTSEEELELWGKNVSSFWTSQSHSFVPENTDINAACSILIATIHFQSKTHGDCLKGRFIALY